MYVLTRSFHTVPVVILFSAHPFSTGTSTDHLHLYGTAILPHRISRIVRLRSTTMCGLCTLKFLSLVYIESTWTLVGGNMDYVDFKWTLVGLHVHYMESADTCGGL